MLSTLLFLALVGGSVLNVESLAVYKCDPALVKEIKDKYWNNGPNNEILEKLVSSSSEDNRYILKSSTPEYIDDEYSGVYTTFVKKDGNVFTTQKLSFIKKDDGSISKLERDMIEAGGSVIGKSDSKVTFYNINQDNDVYAFYTCFDSDKAETGSPAGFVIVKENGGYTDDQYNTAVDKLTSVGIIPSLVYKYS